MSDHWLESLTTIAEMEDEVQDAKLLELEDEAGEESAETDLEPIDGESFELGLEKGLFTQAWKFKGHVFGYLPTRTEAGEGDLVPIKSAGSLEGDKTLIGQRVVITLDRLMVTQYPGRGERTILFNFSAKNALEKGSEQLHFNQTYQARNGEMVAVQNIPIFVGLTVGEIGIDFGCGTVNVKNKADEKFLEFLGGDVAKKGLELATTAQPAIAPLANVALGIVQKMAERNRNVAVQTFGLGLDFADTLTGARLREGSYVVVQSGADSWNWEHWAYSRTRERMVNINAPDEAVPFNYIVFGVSRYSEN